MILQVSFTTQDSFMFLFGVCVCFRGFVTASPDSPLRPYELEPLGLVLNVCVLGFVTALARPSPYIRGTNEHNIIFEEALQSLCRVSEEMPHPLARANGIECRLFPPR